MVHLVMAIFSKQTSRILNFYQTNIKVMLQKHLLKMHISHLVHLVNFQKVTVSYETRSPSLFLSSMAYVIAL